MEITLRVVFFMSEFLEFNYCKLQMALKNAER